MESLGADSIRDKTQALSPASVAEKTKHISTKARRALEEEASHEYTILENRDVVLEKLGQQELEIKDKIHNLLVNYNMLGQKLRDGSDGYRKFSNAQYNIEWKLEEMERLKQLLYELYEKPNKQIVKLHKGTHHGNMNLVKERQLLKQIKLARGEAEKMSTSGLETKEALKDYIKVKSSAIDELRMERLRYRAYGRLRSEQTVIEKEIIILRSKLRYIKQMKVEASTP